MAKPRAEVEGGGGGAKKRRKMNRVDHISRLCDTIIHHIISFLPVRDAAQTCVLSRRWRHVWASIPTLDFDQKSFEEHTGARHNEFVDFMSGAVMYRQSVPMQKFRLSLQYGALYYHPIRQWIHMSMKCKVQELYVDFYGGRSHICLGDLNADSLPTPHGEHEDSSDYESDLSYSDYDYYYDNDDDDDDDVDNDQTSLLGPWNTWLNFVPSFFTYGSLRVLRLMKCNLNHKGAMNFGSLTTLSLKEVHIPGNVLHRMLSGCFMLQNLELNQMFGLKNLKVSAPRLQSMKLECCRCLKSVLIDARELRHFKCIMSLRTSAITLHSPALIKAELGICHKLDSNTDTRISKIKALLEVVGHAKDLTLNSNFLEDMTMTKNQLENFPPLHNVKRLEMIGRMSNGAVVAIACLLVAFDSLESLSLSLIPSRLRRRVDMNQKNVQLQGLEDASISCLWLHLKELKIHRFEGKQSEIKLLEFLIKNAKVLETVDIKTYTPSSLSHREIKARMSLWRTSQDTKIQYV